MLDLFSQGKSTQELITLLENDVKAYRKKQGVESRSKTKIYYGNLEYINNNILIVTSPPKARIFETANDKNISDLLLSHGITNFFITYFHFISKEQISKKDIKDFGFYVRGFADIISPRIIVCLGEDAQLSFFKKKFLIEDYHGKEIGDFEGIPIYTTYPMEYYTEHSKFEDDSYKESLKDEDWNIIKERYKGVIS
jgi:hypothetical protein